jgi:Na+-transporting methylmalonyl-CoA/oxaloacetate decarboxylase gamma subunit
VLIGVLLILVFATWIISAVRRRWRGRVAAST